MREAVALRSGARCRAVRRGGVKDGVRPRVLNGDMSRFFDIIF